MGMKLTGPGTSLPALHIGLSGEKGGKGQELLGLRPSLPDLSMSERLWVLEASLHHGPSSPGIEPLRALGNPFPRLGLIFKSHLWLKFAAGHSLQLNPAMALGPLLSDL